MPFAFVSVGAAADAKRAGFFVELKAGPHISLHLTLLPAGEKAVEVPLDQLPWARRESMVLVACIAGGRCLDRGRPVEDPAVIKIAIDPHRGISRDIDLEGPFPDLRRVLRKSDVQLFWAYEAPEELGIGHWSGGWMLIEKRP